MITFHPDFVAIKEFPGYFWNKQEQTLFSIKGGSLRELKLNRPNRWVYWHDGPFYCISHDSRRRYLFKDVLIKKYSPIEENYELPY